MRVQIPGLAPGVSYNVQFRARSVDTVSEWSRSFLIACEGDTVAPLVPANFTASMDGTTFNLSWDAVRQSADGSAAYDMDHYRIKIDTGTQVGYVNPKYISTDNTVTYAFSLDANKAMFGSPKPDLRFSVQAVDHSGNQSPATPEIHLVNPAPGPVTNFVMSAGIDTVYGQWTPPADTDIAQYRVHMSTSASFTPDTSNLVYAGMDTQFTLPSDSYSTPLFFIIFVQDVFGSLSAPVNGGPVTPKSTFTVDSTAPAAPTNLAAVITTNGDLSTSAKVTWTPPANPDNDLSGYTIGCRKAGATDWSTVTADGDATSTTIDKLSPYTNYEFRIRAYDFSFNYSPWTTVASANGAVNVKPSVPAAPTVAGNPQSIQITHGLKKIDGSALESDVVALKFYVGTTSTFTADDTTLKAQVAVNSAPVVVVNLPIPVVAGSTGRWVRVVAVDGGGLVSDPSAAAAVTVQLTDWAAITNVSVTNAQIQNLDANKINAGTGFINNMTVKSIFTLGDATTDGSVQSFGYTAGVSGFKLAKSGLEINDGSIAAKALRIQVGQNIVPAQYADFEWASAYYTTNIAATSQTVTIGLSGSKYGSQYLSVRSTTAAATDTYFGPTSSTYNINIEPNTAYILSAWVRSGAVATTAALRLRYSDGTYSAASGQTLLPANGIWQRISGVITTPASASTAIFDMYNSTAAIGAGFDIDGVQVEKQLTSVTTPSPWNPPSSTTIDGGQVRTGEIRSNQNVTVNGVSQPSWSINTSGGAQFGSASVRGSLYVGGTDGSTDAGQSKVQSANYLAGSRGWVIRSDGFAEFRNLAVNSLSVTTLDSPLQNTVATKLYDYMEDATLWTVRSGIITPQTNVTGAYSAKALLQATGDTTVTRDAAGMTGGIAYEPEALYRITGRVRQITSDININPLTSIGVVGYNDSMQLCGYDGSADINKQYEIAASQSIVNTFDGTVTDSAGWQTFVGYLKGRSSTIGINTWPVMADSNADGLYDSFTKFVNNETNMIFNGDFEDGSNDISKWSVYTSSGVSTMSITSDNAISGGQSLQITGATVTGQSRGGIIALDSPLPAGANVNVRFTGSQLSDAGEPQHAWRIALQGTGASWQFFDFTANPDSSPVTFNAAAVVPAGETLVRIFMYQTGVPASSTNATIIDDVYVAASALPTATVTTGQTITAPTLYQGARSGVKITMPEPVTDSLISVDYTMTAGLNVGVSASSDANGGTDLGTAVNDDTATTGTLILSAPTGNGKNVTVSLYMFNDDATLTNTSVTFKNFSIISGIGAAPDQYNPGSVHDNVRYIAPYVRMNENAPGMVAQLDAFTIETFEAGAQTKVSTSEGHGMRSITVENIENDDANIDHAVRFFTGDISESKPGAIGMYVDGDRNDALSLLITPPRASKENVSYSEDAIVMTGRNTNILANSSFDFADFTTGWTSYDANTVLALNQDDGVSNAPCLQLTATRDGVSQGPNQAIQLSAFPNLAQATKFSASGYIKPLTRDAQVRFRLDIYKTDGNGVDTRWLDAYYPTFSTAPVGQWTQVTASFDVDPVNLQNSSRIELLMYVQGTGVLTGDSWLFDDLQLEVGNLTPYKPQQPSRTFIGTDVNVVKNALIIGDADSVIIANGTAPTSKNFSNANTPFVSSQPQLYLDAPTGTYTVGGLDYLDSGTNAHRAFAEIAGWMKDGSARSAGGMRLFSGDDDISPMQVALYNGSGANFLWSQDKYGNTDPDITRNTKDVTVGGFLTSQGDAPWVQIEAASGWAHYTNGYVPSGYVDGGVVTLRGHMQRTGGAFTPTPGSFTIMNLPSNMAPANTIWATCTIMIGNTTSGVGTLLIYNTGQVSLGYSSLSSVPTGAFISFDSVSFSRASSNMVPTPPGGTVTPPSNTADTTPPGAPSGFSVNARTSGTTVGSYTLKWTNPGATDLAGVKIIWRTDRYPSVTIPSSGKRTLTTDGKIIAVAGSPGAARSYIHSSIPVGKTIYYRMVAYDKSGNHSTYVSKSRFLLKSPQVFTADSSHTYRTSYGGNWSGPDNSDDLYQGDYFGYNNGYRGCWFYGNDIYNALNKGGVRRTPTKISLYAYRQNSSHGSSSATELCLKAHPHATRPSGAPTLNGSADGIVSLLRGQGKTFNIPTSWLSGFATGSNKGFGVYTTNSANYMILTGHNTYASNGKVTVYHNG